MFNTLELLGHGHWELFLSEVNKRETVVAIEADNDTYCLQNWIEKFPLSTNNIFIH